MTFRPEWVAPERTTSPLSLESADYLWTLKLLESAHWSLHVAPKRAIPALYGCGLHLFLFNSGSHGLVANYEDESFLGRECSSWSVDLTVRVKFKYFCFQQIFYINWINLNLSLWLYLNWDSLSGTSDCFKDLCNFLNLVQSINAPTRPNPKVHKNLPATVHKFIWTRIFCNNITVHCVTACIQNTKIPKVKSCCVSFKCILASMSRHVSYSDLNRVSLIPHVYLALNDLHF